MRIPLVALACLLFAFAADAGPPEVELSPDDGLTVRFPDADTALHLGGRLHLDWATFDEDTSRMPSDFEVRRARPYVEATVADDWRAKVEYEITDASDASDGSRGWRNTWLGYEGLPHTSVRVGNANVPFGLEESGSSNHYLFAERSLAGAIGPSFGTGGFVRVGGKLYRRSRWMLAGGVSIEPFDSTRYDRHRSDHVGYAGRAVFAPLVRKRSLIQLGGSLEYRSVFGNDRWRISSHPESIVAPRLIGVTLSEVDDVISYGAEAAALWGPLLAQGEFMRAEVQRQSSSSASDPSFQGAYAQVSWVITGERHRYSRRTATIDGVKPRHWWGAVEVAGRWSTLDLTDSGVVGGKETDLSAGLNWYLRQNLRLMFNYIHVDAERAGTLESDDPQIFQLRLMYFL